MKAKKKPLDIRSLSDFGVDPGSVGSATIKIKAMNPPPERKGGRIIEGESVQEKVAELVRALHEEAKVI
jgi:electron transfer flavoprotein beta subunit